MLELNKIHCGDARDLLPQVESNSVALAIWSPPYHVGKEYEKGQTFDDWKQLISGVISAHTRIIVSGGFMVVNIADILCFKDESVPKIQAANTRMLKCGITKQDIEKAKELFPEYNRHQLAKHLGCSEQTVDRRLNGNNIRGGKYSTQTRIQLVGHLVDEFARAAGLYLYDKRVWVKDPTWANSQWHSNSYRAISESEDLYVFWKPGETVVDRNRLTSAEWSEWGSRQVWYIKSVRANDDHEAKFPLELPRRFIQMLTKPGDVVLDCFVGSGTTAVAAKKEGRRYIGIDLLPQYVELAEKNVSGE